MPEAYAVPQSPYPTGPVLRTAIVKTEYQETLSDGTLPEYNDYTGNAFYVTLNELIHRRWGHVASLCPFVFAYCPKWRFWIVKDVVGWAGVISTWLLILVGEAMLFGLFIIPRDYNADLIYSAVHGTLSFCWASLGFIAHVRATFTDPVSSICVTDSVYAVPFVSQTL